VSLIVPAKATLYFFYDKTLFSFNKTNRPWLLDRYALGQIPWLIHIRTAQILLYELSANTSMIALPRSVTGGRRGKVSQGLVQQLQFDTLTTSNLEEDKYMSLIVLRSRPLVNDAATSPEQV